MIAKTPNIRTHKPRKLFDGRYILLSCLSKIKRFVWSGLTHQMAPELFQCQAPEQNKIIVTDTAGSNAGAGQYKACGLGNYLILEDHIHHHKKKIQLTTVWFAPEAEMKSSSQHKIP